MESTKVVSLRMDRNRYDEILLFCSKRGIPVSEWIDGRLAIADLSEEMFIQIQERIEEAIDLIDTIPAAAKRRLRSLLRDL
jgi:endogenous inhibitor of DNA gyrase (YacG/DUF329 family)